MTQEKSLENMDLRGFDALYYLGAHIDGLKSAYLAWLLQYVLILIPIINLMTPWFVLILSIWIVILRVKILLKSREIGQKSNVLEMRVFWILNIALLAFPIFQIAAINLASIFLYNMNVPALAEIIYYSYVGISAFSWLLIYKLIRDNMAEYRVTSQKWIFYLVIIASAISAIDSTIGYAVGQIILCLALPLIKRSFHVYYYEMTARKDQQKKLDDVLVLDDLKTFYPIRGGFFMTTVGFIKAVNGVSFSIKRGETLGLVGESGCGKTTIGKTILGLAPRNGGRIVYNGEAIPNIFPPYLRRKIQFIFQDPDASLNPRMTVFQIISEPLRNLNPELDKTQIKMRVLELMSLVSLQYEHLYRFPHEFSGGQKQRIVIARALACNPEFLVLDEPTSALDVSVQAQILNLLEDLQKRFNLSYLFITHDLSVLHHIAKRIAVMYLGKIVEIGSVDNVFNRPSHPYTRALLSARSIPDPEQARDRIVLTGEVPSPINPPSGCPFHPRCYYVMKDKRCSQVEPVLIEIEPDHFVSTSQVQGENTCWAG